MRIGDSSITRRQFLSRSARLAATAGLSLSVLGLAGCGGGSSSNNSAWADLASRISGPVLRPGDSGYLAAALPNNLRYASILPEGIAECTSVSDVAQAIRWSRQHNIPLTTRSGGHNYAGFSTTRGLMIDMKRINQFEFDSSSGVVTIGGGILNSVLYSALRAANATITHGRCIRVGGAGFLLGGGIGFNMRRYQLGCDLMLDSQLVTADGEILTLSNNENSPLFWACRGGGGGNFGINTSFSLQTVPADELLTVFQISWSGKSDAVYASLLDALQAAPDTMGNRVEATAVTAQQQSSGQDVVITLLGQLAGSTDELADILAPVYKVAAPISSDIRQLPYWDGQDFLDELGPPSFYQERSSFFVGAPSSQAVDTAFSFLRNWPGTSQVTGLALFQTGGQIKKVAPDATAFVHRNSDWLMSIQLVWDKSDSAATVQKNLEWQAAFYQAMRNFSSGAYVNFPDISLTTWQQDYYGANLSRLESIKAQVDPTQVFKFAQSIPPVSTAERQSNRQATAFAASRNIPARAA